MLDKNKSLVSTLFSTTSEGPSFLQVNILSLFPSKQDKITQPLSWYFL